MIGPSSGGKGVAGSEVAEDHLRAVKRKVLEDLNIGTFCEEVYREDGKRYRQQELQSSLDLLSSGQVTTTEGTSSLFSPFSPISPISPISPQGAAEESPVARLEVVVVDGGTSCTWTTSTSTSTSTLVERQTEFTELNRYISSASSSSPMTEDLGEQHFQPVQSIELLSGDCVDYQRAMTSSGYWRTSGPSVATSSGNVSFAPKTAQAGPFSNSGPQYQPQQQQQQQQPQQQIEDQENGNLSWLLDFKLDPFIESPDDRCANHLPGFLKDNHYGNKNKPHANGRPNGSTNATSDLRRGYGGNHENDSTLRQDANHPTNCAPSDARNVASARCNGPKKPPFTYTELIEHALQEKGELTVSAIYQWISEHFPYYKSNDDRWKNSVRHNLSINPHFRKGSKAPHGAGHLWAIANRGDSRPRQINASTAVHSTARALIKAELQNAGNIYVNDNNPSEMISIEEVEAATASITESSLDEEVNGIVNSVTLEHCAEQILSGVKKEVQVQYLVPMVVSNGDEQNTVETNRQSSQMELHCPARETDFLNPVSKEVVAEECGLIGEGYLVTDLNPATLGLNMVDPELISPENLFGEELSFQFYELTSPSQLQSA